jgi:hypothetical protein
MSILFTSPGFSDDLGVSTFYESCEAMDDCASPSS